jgi:hypothetical protein
MAISLVNQATASSKTSSTTLTITVPTGGFPAGSTLIVLIVSDVGGQTISSITDSAGNSYVVDKTSGMGATPTAGTTFVARSSNILALSAGQTITITFGAATTAKAVNVSCWDGLDLTNPKDRDSAATNTGTSITSGPTLTTTQADELVIGPAAVKGSTGDTFTPVSGLTALTRVGTSGGSAASNVTLNSLYKIVSVTGQYSIGGTNSASRDWGAIVVTYKAALPRGRSFGYIF